jgi:hypothetical protein
MLKEIIKGNVIGVLIMLFAYLIHFKLYRFLKLKDQKPASFKRIWFASIVAVYQGLVLFVAANQLRSDNETGKSSIAFWFILFFYFFSMWVFAIDPIRKEYNEK